MRKSAWLPTSAIVVLGFGLGHAGCYTSGIPGGRGAGGIPSQGDASAQAGTGGTGTDAGGEGGDSGTQVDSGATTRAPCEENSECDGVPGKPVCVSSTGVCVQCIADSDCDSAQSSDADAGGTGGSSSSSKQHCVNTVCRTYTACDFAGKCTGGAGLCDPNLKRCVQCIDTVDCSTPGTTCAGTSCRQVCSTANSCPDSSPVCLKVGTSSICTERCASDSDCLLGYVCSQKICTPA
jgi:hypothetical protein